MYTAIVEVEFTATHRVRLPSGELEAPHAHTWRARAEFARADLDDNDMVVDFGHAQEALRRIVLAFEGADLNANPAFAGRLPTAEVVARIVFDELLARGLGSVHRVTVTEAPGCAGSYGRSP